MILEMLRGVWDSSRAASFKVNVLPYSKRDIPTRLVRAKTSTPPGHLAGCVSCEKNRPDSTNRRERARPGPAPSAKSRGHARWIPQSISQIVFRILERLRWGENRKKIQAQSRSSWFPPLKVIVLMHEHVGTVQLVLFRISVVPLRNPRTCKTVKVRKILEMSIWICNRVREDGG